MILAILLGVSVAVNLVAAYVIFRLVRKLFQFDELFELLQDDIHTNVRHLEKTLNQPLLMNTPEIVEAHNGMRTMAVRLYEYGLRFKELKGTLEEKKPLPRPVVA